MTQSLNKNQQKHQIPFFDYGRIEDALILAGMGRSGTTWAADVINYDKSCSVMFEPFYPAAVHEAHGFEYIQYLSPESRNDALEKQAQGILSGKVRNKWIDRDISRTLYRYRIIKDIRSNLMLGWLKKIAKHTPIVLLIRHPLQVALSWRRLGWDQEKPGGKNDYEIITSQQDLLRDFPLIKDVMKMIDPLNFLDRVVFQWCVYCLVPAKHLGKGDAHALFYELLVTDPEHELRNLFHYLDKPFHWDKVKKAISIPSHTSFRNKEYLMDTKQLVEGWKTQCTAKQVERADSILEAFGLETMYNSKGYPAGQEMFQG